MEVHQWLHFNAGAGKEEMGVSMECSDNEGQPTMAAMIMMHLKTLRSKG